MPHPKLTSDLTGVDTAAATGWQRILQAEVAGANEPLPLASARENQLEAAT